MPTVTKSYQSRLRGISVTPDGKTVAVSLEWAPDQTSPQDRRTMTSLAITDGKVVVAGTKVADAPADLAKLAAGVASAVSSLVDSLVTSGKVKP